MPPAPPLEYEVTVAASFSRHSAPMALTGSAGAPGRAWVSVL